MFMGEHSHSIDAKGRLIIPAKFRDGLGDSFVITQGMDHCLTIYPESEWETFQEQLNQLPRANKEARMFRRFFTAKAATCELDKQGRILVPQALRDYAGLEKDVVLTGNISNIEVWSKDRWDEISDYDDMDDIAERMQDMGITI
ncbi:MAG: division/cell wall cluster transcriptional repressor MraZ [Lachnospiraceae bacterium]|nr:division/cell wall cluster transcriptional repressor MraZ [Lachnospiraceae bacterium]